MYRKNVEKMTNVEYITFVNEKLQEIEIFEKILNENKILIEGEMVLLKQDKQH